jgi:hypothetical protein
MDFSTANIIAMEMIVAPIGESKAYNGFSNRLFFDKITLVITIILTSVIILNQDIVLQEPFSISETLYPSFFLSYSLFLYRLLLFLFP